jgi:hypothetical protein
MARQKAEEERKEKEQLQAEKMADAYIRAYKAGQFGQGANMIDIIQKYELDVNKPKIPLKDTNKRKTQQGPPKRFESIMHVAAIACGVETVKWLEAQGADCTALNEAKLSPFHVAVLSGNLSVVNFFLGLKATPENCHPSKAAVDAGNRTPLEMAVASGDVEVVRVVMNHAPVHGVQKCYDALGGDKASEAIKDVLLTKVLEVFSVLLLLIWCRMVFSLLDQHP